MSTFECQEQSEQDRDVFKIFGYFSGETGREVQQKLEVRLKAGRKKFILDFSGCKLINSPGAVLIMDMAMRVVDDCHGRLVICGLGEVQVATLSMIGVFPLAQFTSTLEEALQSLA